MKKLLSILLALALILSLGVIGFASGEASGEASAEEDTGPKAVFVFGDEGEDTENEQTENYELTFYDGGALSETGLRGFRFTSDSSAAASSPRRMTESAASTPTECMNSTASAVPGNSARS